MEQCSALQGEHAAAHLHCLGFVLPPAPPQHDPEGNSLLRLHLLLLPANLPERACPSVPLHEDRDPCQAHACTTGCPCEQWANCTISKALCRQAQGIGMALCCQAEDILSAVH